MIELNPWVVLALMFSWLSIVVRLRDYSARICALEEAVKSANTYLEFEAEG